MRCLNGGTNPKELHALGAPTNDQLKHLPRLHAKVYLSSEGVVVCSANASTNGIGFVGAEAGLIEAGAGYEAETAAAREAAVWFEQIWKRSTQVDDDALAIAEAAWARRPKTGPLTPLVHERPGSLLDALALGGEKVRGFGVAFTNVVATSADLEATVDAVGQETSLTNEERRELRNWNVGDLFSGWTAAEISAWPMHFVCAHQNSSGRVAYHFYERVYAVVLSEGRGMLLARRSRTLRPSMGFTQSAEALNAIDADRLSKIFAHLDGEGLLCENGEKVATLLDRVG